MNPVLIPVHNSLELTKQAIASILKQDLDITLYVIDNASTDDTRQWLNDNRILHWTRGTNGVSAAWNHGLDYLFNTADCEHVLCVNNDVVLRPDTYRVLLEDGGLFVTAVSVGDVNQLDWDGVPRKRPHPDFSCYVIRKEVWDRVGKFDESMVLYCSDGDYHLRGHRVGVECCTIGIPFYHYASGTLKSATDEERQKIQHQADADRVTFERKWGVKMGSDEYYKLFNGSRP
jgi:GT2 family glycosyltransferase